MRRVALLVGVLVFMVSVYNSSSALAKDAGGKTTKEIYELQEQCGKSSAEFFSKKHGIIGFSNPFYKNHYNRKLNKCFIQIWYPADDQDSKVPVGNIELWDVQENMPYGSFIKPLGAKIEDCHILNKRCNSKGEWDASVKPYMEE
jgi:hypothetical protein